MLSRSARVVSSCVRCQSRLVNNPVNLALRPLRPTLVRPRAPPSQCRLFSTPPPPPPPAPSPQPSAEDTPPYSDSEPVVASDDATTSTDSSSSSSSSTTPPPDDSKPWYLQADPPTQTTPLQHAEALPEIPANSPAVLEPLVKYVYEEMGLDEISLLDLRSLETPPALGPNLIMLFGTARSQRHLNVSAGRLVRWLRRQHSIPVTAAGLVSPTDLKVKLRRMRKRENLVGSSAFDGRGVTGADDGISTGWVCVNLGVIGENRSEEVRLDHKGRMTGFGRTPSGTTIVLQAMTAERRKEIELERLWETRLEKNRRVLASLDAPPPPKPAPPPKYTDADFQRGSSSNSSSSRNRNRKGNNEPRLQAGTHDFESFSGQASSPFLPSRPAAPRRRGRRAYSTTTTTSNATPPPSVCEMSQQLNNVQTSVDSSKGDFLTLVHTILSDTSLAPSAKIELCEPLFLAMQERGIGLLDPSVVITALTGLTQALAAPPDAAAAATAPLRRMQANFETLLAQLPTCPSEPQLAGLMAAYALTHDWPRVWETFRTPPRFCAPRSAALYSAALTLARDTQQPALAADALRRVVPDLLREEPSVATDPALHAVLRQTIDLAEPGAARVVQQLATGEVSDLDRFVDRDYSGAQGLRRQLGHGREFVDMLGAIERVVSARRM